MSLAAINKTGDNVYRRFPESADLRGTVKYRDEEVRQLTEMMRENSIVTVTGESGVGKISLLVKYYQTHGSEYDIVIYFSELNYSSIFYKAQVAPAFKQDPNTFDLCTFLEKTQYKWLVIVSRMDHLTEDNYLSQLSKNIPLSYLQKGPKNANLLLVTDTKPYEQWTEAYHKVEDDETRLRFFEKTLQSKLFPLERFTDSDSLDLMKSFNTPMSDDDLVALNAKVTRGSPVFISNLFKYLNIKKIYNLETILSILEIPEANKENADDASTTEAHRKLEAYNYYSESKLINLVYSEIQKIPGFDRDIFGTFLFFRKYGIPYNFISVIGKTVYQNEDGVSLMMKEMAKYNMIDDDSFYKAYYSRENIMRPFRTRLFTEEDQKLYTREMITCVGIFVKDGLLTPEEMYLNIRHMLYYVEAKTPFEDDFKLILYVNLAQFYSYNKIDVQLGYEYALMGKEIKVHGSNIYEINLYKTIGYIHKTTEFDRFKESNEAYKHAIQLVKKYQNKTIPIEKKGHIFMILSEMSENYSFLNDFNTAIKVNEEALEIYESLSATEKRDLNYYRLMFTQAKAYFGLKDYRKSIHYLRQSINSQKNAASLHLMAKCHAALGDEKKSLQLLADLKKFTQNTRISYKYYEDDYNQYIKELHSLKYALIKPLNLTLTLLTVSTAAFIFLKYYKK